jgi:uncharacterized protein YjiS (DUF1127 family)
MLIRLVRLSLGALRAYGLQRRSRAELARFSSRDLADIGLSRRED